MSLLRVKRAHPAQAVGNKYLQRKRNNEWQVVVAAADLIA
jgi:hypothetical protein